MTRKHLIASAFLVALLGGATGCASGFQGAARVDTPAAWRAFLESGQGSEGERDAARSRLDDLSYAKAHRAGTIAGYKRYLEAFPHGDHAESAMAALEDLRFHAAVGTPGPWALEDFLSRYPSGPHSAAAKALLATRTRKAALASKDPARYRAWLERYPDAPGANVVRRALAQRAFVAASKAGTFLAFSHFVHTFPGDPHRAAADLALKALEIRAGVLAGKLVDARKVVESTGVPAAHATVAAALDGALLDRALRRLDRGALTALAKRPDVGARAKAALDALDARRDHGRRLAAAALTLATPAPGLSEVAVREALASTDPRRRRVAVRALGYRRDPDDLRRLVDALGDEDLVVRLEAEAAIRRLARSLDPLVRDVAFAATLQHLRARAAGSRLRTAEGLVREAAGRPGARKALRDAATNDGRILAPLRLVTLETDPERRWVALTQAASRITADIDDRLGQLDQARTRGPVDVALLRQCEGLETVLRRVLARTAGVARARAHALDLEKVEKLPWVKGARRLAARLHRMLLDAEARARVADPTYVAFDVDEGAAGRATAAKRKLRAVEVLAGALGVPGVRAALVHASRSPLPKVAAAARAALAPKAKTAERGR